MFELTIGGKVYEFNFGMGFMREINKKIGVPVDGLPDVKKNMGLQYTVAGIMDGDLEALVDALDVANKGRVPRVTKEILDNYIDDPETDIDKLFAEVLDFLKKANATKKTVETLLEAIEAEKQKQMNQ
jgi:hypothetical protein